ncbi:MAG: trypsin-like peptidase domain-containing protein [Gallionella sp.]
MKLATRYSLTTGYALMGSSIVFTLGYPLGDLLGGPPKYSGGSVTSLFGIKEDPRTLQIDNPVQPGNSGAPLFDTEGRIIGIVVSTLNAKFIFEEVGAIPQNVNFAIKIEYLLNLIELLPESQEILKRGIRSDNSQLSLEQQIDLLIPSIVRVVSR